MAYPFMPVTAKTIRTVSEAVKDSNFPGNSTKINGKLESEKIKQVSETNPRSLKKIHSHGRTHNRY